MKRRQRRCRSSSLSSSRCCALWKSSDSAWDSMPSAAVAASGASGAAPAERVLAAALAVPEARVCSLWAEPWVGRTRTQVARGPRVQQPRRLITPSANRSWRSSPRRADTRTAGSPTVPGRRRLGLGRCETGRTECRGRVCRGK